MEQEKERRAMVTELEEDDFFIAALIRAAELNLEEEGRAAESEGEMPEELEQRIQEAFGNYRKCEAAKRRGAARRRVGKRLFYAAAIAALLTCFLYATVSGFRNGVYNAVQDISDGIASITIFGGASEEVVKQAYPGLVPEGFICVDSEISPIVSTAEYEYDGDYFKYRRQLLSSLEVGAGLADLEDVLVETVINDRPAQISENNVGDLTIAWRTKVYLYSIMSSLGQELLIQLAESVPAT